MHVIYQKKHLNFTCLFFPIAMSEIFAPDAVVKSIKALKGYKLKYRKIL